MQARAGFGGVPQDFPGAAVYVGGKGMAPGSLDWVDQMSQSGTEGREEGRVSFLVAPRVECSWVQGQKSVEMLRCFF